MNILRRNSVFVSLCFLLIILLVALLYTYPKAELHLLLCDRHTPTRDIFYKYYTYVGEWVPYLICAALLFYRVGWASFTLSCILLSGLVTQILKRIIAAPRPLTYFETFYPEIQLPLVDGVAVSRFFSFPSGHTTSFFALFFALSIIGTNYLYEKRMKSNKPHTTSTPPSTATTPTITLTTNQATSTQLTTNHSFPPSTTNNHLTSTLSYPQVPPTKPHPHTVNRNSLPLNTLFCIIWQILCVACAALGGYSRIYLSQHFAADVLAGMGIGLLITALLYVLFRQHKDRKWWKMHIFQKKMQ